MSTVAYVFATGRGGYFFVKPIYYLFFRNFLEYDMKTGRPLPKVAKLSSWSKKMSNVLKCKKTRKKLPKKFRFIFLGNFFFLRIL